MTDLKKGKNSGYRHTEDIIDYMVRREKLIIMDTNRNRDAPNGPQHPSKPKLSNVLILMMHLGLYNLDC